MTIGGITNNNINMCKRGNRRSRRVSNCRTRFWVNQYNNIENNYGTVINLSKDSDEYEPTEQPIIAVQVINEHESEQKSASFDEETVQKPVENAKATKASVLRSLVIGVAVGIVLGGVNLFIKKKTS